MILPDFMIKEYAQQGMIEPFEPKYINPASLDLTLYGEIIEITPGGVIDASNSGSASNRLTTQKHIKLQHGQKYLLQPGIFILASSIEVLNLPYNIAANVQLKSTTARSGIGHVYAGWIDPGFSGQITFELFSHVPVLLEPGKPVCQITFLQMAAIPEKPYQGKYQNQQGPTPARQLSFEEQYPILDNYGKGLAPNPVGLVEAIEHTNIVTQEIIQAIAEDFSSSSEVVKDTWSKRSILKIDRDWGEEE